MHVPIPVDDVRAALPHWGIDEAELSELPRGATAEVWKVECAQGTFVAKYAYDDRDHFENGLRAAEVALEVGLRSAAPQRTNDGELTVMLEWPTGHWHPLTLLHWVDGESVDATQPGIEEDLGRLFGTLQAALAQHMPADADADPFSYLDYLEGSPQDLGDNGELQAAVEAIARRAREIQGATQMTVATAVWDGPDIVVDGEGRLGLIDFGYCRPLPVVHGLANRSVTVSLEEDERTARFVNAFVEVFPLTNAELKCLGIFRLVSLAIYCKYQAWRLTIDTDPEVRGRMQSYLDEILPLVTA